MKTSNKLIIFGIVCVVLAITAATLTIRNSYLNDKAKEELKPQK